MTREQLEHAIRAACDVAEDTELYVFGSQATLGSQPDVVKDRDFVGVLLRETRLDRLMAKIGSPGVCFPGLERRWKR